MNLDVLKGKEIIVEQTGSSIACSDKQKGTLKGLGLRKIGSKSELKATDEVIGMLRKVAHLVKAEAK